MVESKLNFVPCGIQMKIILVLGFLLSSTSSEDLISSTSQLVDSVDTISSENDSSKNFVISSCLGSCNMET